MPRPLPLTPVLAGVLAVALGGCLHLPSLASLIKIRAVPADLGAVGPNAAEDRLYADAVREIDKRDYGQALDALQVARTARPDDARVLTAMGVVYDKLGRFDLSDRYYDQAEKVDPGSRILAIDRRYSIYLRGLGKPAGAAEASAAGAPKLPAGDELYAQAVQAIQKHEYGVALTVLRQAKDARPDDARVLTALGVTYDHLGRFDLSTRYYDLAEKADPGSQVVAQDRRTSIILQQHGGASSPDDVIVLANSAGKALVRVAKAGPAPQAGRS